MKLEQSFHLRLPLEYESYWLIKLLVQAKINFISPNKILGYAKKLKVC